MLLYSGHDLECPETEALASFTLERCFEGDTPGVQYKYTCATGVRRAASRVAKMTDCNELGHELDRADRVSLAEGLSKLTMDCTDQSGFGALARFTSVACLGWSQRLEYECAASFERSETVTMQTDCTASQRHILDLTLQNVTCPRGGAISRVEAKPCSFTVPTFAPPSRCPASLVPRSSRPLASPGE